MVFWRLAFLSMIITCTVGQVKSAQQESRLFAKGDNDARIIALANEVHSKGWIIYSARTDKGDWDLFLMRPDGSDCRNITNTPVFNEAAARFSPDGQKILYYRMPKDVAVDNNKYGLYDLVIADTDGANPVVWGNDYHWASWGPDSKKLACLSIKGIWLIDLSTKKTVKELSRKGIVQQLVWSPDGKYVLFTQSQQDLGEVDNSQTTMVIIRSQDAPVIIGRNEALRKAYPITNDGPVLHISCGWEPHWTYAAIDIKK